MKSDIYGAMIWGIERTHPFAKKEVIRSIAFVGIYTKNPTHIARICEILCIPTKNIQEKSIHPRRGHISILAMRLDRGIRSK